MRPLKANHNIINTLFDSQTLIMGGSVPERVPWAIFERQADAPPWKRSFFRGAESRGVWFILKTGPATSSSWPSGTSRTSPTSTGSIHLACNGDARLASTFAACGSPKPGTSDFDDHLV